MASPYQVIFPWAIQPASATNAYQRNKLLYLLELHRPFGDAKHVLDSDHLVRRAHGGASELNINLDYRGRGPGLSSFRIGVLAEVCL